MIRSVIPVFLMTLLAGSSYSFQYSQSMILHTTPQYSQPTCLMLIRNRFSQKNGAASTNAYRFTCDSKKRETHLSLVFLCLYLTGIYPVVYLGF